MVDSMREPGRGDQEQSCGKSDGASDGRCGLRVDVCSAGGGRRRKRTAGRVGSASRRIGSSGCKGKGTADSL
jgi:hypothetical protein